ncbi:hypothetical protein LguiB_013068 [Lonicera macranthoides]
MKNCPFEITKNPNNSIKMSRERSSHKLTDNMDSISNIWASNIKINQTAN